MNRDAKLRKLARSNYWQNLYSASLKNLNIKLFKNDYNYTSDQVRFLYWLSVYHLLYEELNTYVDELLTINVINDDLRTDAYLIHRQHKNDYLWKKHRQEEKEAQINANRKKGFKNPGKVTTINVDLRREDKCQVQPTEK